jgi:hypothetical protein
MAQMLVNLKSPFDAWENVHDGNNVVAVVCFWLFFLFGFMAVMYTSCTGCMGMHEPLGALLRTSLEVLLSVEGAPLRSPV